jgi:hypothetical protein
LWHFAQGADEVGQLIGYWVLPPAAVPLNA